MSKGKIFFTINLVLCLAMIIPGVYAQSDSEQVEKAGKKPDSFENSAGKKSDSDNDSSKYQKMQNHYKIKWENAVKAIELDNENVNLLMEAGNVGQLLGKRREALNYYKKAVKLILADTQADKKEAVNLQRNIIYLYLRMDNINMAVVEYKNLCLIEPDNMELIKEFAEFLKLHGYPERAFEEYKKILDRNPDDLVVIDQIMQLQSSGYITKEQIDPYINKNKKN